jgi:hypothetical protein
MDKPINRGEMARMIVRANKGAYPSNIKDYEKYIPDYNYIPQEYKDFVLKAYSAGIIKGYDDSTFRYERTATRAEASTMILRLLEEKKREAPDLTKPVPQMYIDPDPFKPAENPDRSLIHLTVEQLDYIDPVAAQIKRAIPELKALKTGDGYITLEYNKGAAPYTKTTVDIRHKINGDLDSSTIYTYEWEEIEQKAFKEAIKAFLPEEYEYVIERAMALSTEHLTEYINVKGDNRLLLMWAANLNNGARVAIFMGNN